MFPFFRDSRATLVHTGNPTPADLMGEVQPHGLLLANQCFKQRSPLKRCLSLLRQHESFGLNCRKDFSNPRISEIRCLIASIQQEKLSVAAHFSKLIQRVTTNGLVTTNVTSGKTSQGLIFYLFLFSGKAKKWRNGESKNEEALKLSIRTLFRSSVHLTTTTNLLPSN